MERKVSVQKDIKSLEASGEVILPLLDLLSTLSISHELSTLASMVTSATPPRNISFVGDNSHSRGPGGKAVVSSIARASGFQNAIINPVDRLECCQDK